MGAEFKTIEVPNDVAADAHELALLRNLLHAGLLIADLSTDEAVQDWARKTAARLKAGR